MKLGNERSEELALEELDQIRGGAGIRVFRSDAELNKLTLGLQQPARGVLNPLDVWMVRASSGDGIAPVERSLPGSTHVFDVDDSERYAHSLQER
ncbi:MAG: hypothetical protein RL685_2143 [Pseudomonadota bacterium]|jgi:hypothetical protein